MSAFMQVDLPALLAALLALVACGTTGHWLVLRKEALAGDAIAHAVLPGLVGGFLVTGSRSAAAMFVGAALAGLAAVLLASFVRHRARTDAATALGIVFTAAFATGVALLETQGARQVDLDPECVLFGSLESIFAVVPPGAHGVGAWTAALPVEVRVLAVAAVGSLGLTLVLRKELASLCFDRAFARTSGAAPRWLEPLLLAATSAAIVASFAAVGSVLVVALLCAPSLLGAPFARTATRRLGVGLAIAALLASAGYALAAHADIVLGTPTALNASGMIACVLAAAVPVVHLSAPLLARRAAAVSRPTA